MPIFARNAGVELKPVSKRDAGACLLVPPREKDASTCCGTLRSRPKRIGHDEDNPVTTKTPQGISKLSSGFTA